MREKRPQPGERYRHFKDKLYQVIAVAVHSETQEELVIYQALYGDFTVYARPLAQFIAEVDPKKYPNIQQKYRFEKVEQTENAIHSEKNQQYETEHAMMKSDKKSSSMLQSGKQTTSISEPVSGSGINQQPVSTSKPVLGSGINQQPASASKSVLGSGSNQQSVSASKPVSGSGINQQSASASEPISKNAPDRTQVLLDFLDCDSYEEKLEYLQDNKKYMDDRMMNDISFALDIVIEEGELEDRIRTLERCLKTLCRFEGNRLR